MSSDPASPVAMTIIQGTVNWSSDPTGQSSPVLARSAPPGYTIDQELGRGGMGVVYAARQVALNRKVALKIILSGGHAGESGLIRFRQEAELTARLQHPNIVQVFETGEHEGLPYLSMEFCSGGSLHQKLASTPMKPKAAAALGEILARAIQHAHENGVLHRDLKPQNVMLTGDGTPKLMDFGLAKRLDADDSKTQEGSILGTPSYMAPEQADGKIYAIGRHSDVYGLGAVLYELLTGRPPFRAATAMETVLQVIREEPVPPRRLQPNLSRDLETITLKCLEKDPKKRYASATDLADDLHRFQKGEAIHARPIGPLGRLARWSARHPALVGVIATFFAVLIVFVIGLVSMLHERERQLRDLSVSKNASDARHVASTVLLRLQSIGRAVQRAAEDQRLREFIRSGDRESLRKLCQEIEARGEIANLLKGTNVDPVASWMVLDAMGTILAVSHNEGIKIPQVPGRDYFHGALLAHRASGRPSIHISRGYRSINQNLNKFALSMTIIDPKNPDTILGVLVMTMTTGASLGSPLKDGEQSVALALPHDTSPQEEVPKERPAADYMLVVHPAYQPRQEPVRLSTESFLPFQIDFARESQVCNDPPLVSTDQYFDPAGKFDPSFGGCWWAGFAQVGNSEMVVIVQQSQDQAIAADRAMIWQIANWAGGTLGVGLALTLGIVIVRSRKN